MVTVKAVNRTQPVIKEMAIHLRTMAKPPKKVVGLWGDWPTTNVRMPAG